MAQAPRWKYARKTVSWREKVLSLVVLLALVGVAGLFAWNMRTSRAVSPFAVDQNLIASAARPAAMTTAEYLLPPGSRLVKRQGSVPRSEQIGPGDGERCPRPSREAGQTQMDLRRRLPD